MKKVNNNLNYSGAALSTDGVLYIGTQSNNKIFGLNTADGSTVYEESVGQQVRHPFRLSGQASLLVYYWMRAI